jgi:hypothetical protein
LAETSELPSPARLSERCFLEMEIDCLRFITH